jgi:serine/threonine-protein phosphatase 6 regulatory ankyrin repeat subunit B
LDTIQAREAYSDLLESPTTLLHAAIFAQHDLAYRLLAQGADVNQRDMDTGWTALLAATEQEQNSLFDLVLQKSLDVNEAGPYGRTALSFAAEHGSEHKVRSLLKRNADYLFSCYGTPLTYAAKNHRLQVVLLLLEQKKDVDLADGSHRSALTSAVTFGDAQFVELIYEKGKLDQPDWPCSYTILLHRAARRGDLAVVKWLLGQSVGGDASGYNWQTPLTLAVYSRNDAVVELLLRHGARLDARDVDHATALHWALPHWTEQSLKIPKFDPTLVTQAKCGLPVNSNIVKMLVEAGADLEAKNAMGETPLTCAAINGSESAVRLLLEKGVNVESRDKLGSVPLLLAPSKGYMAVVCLLLEYGASIDSTNANGDTAFDACRA